jgi:hypothetical protein
MQRKDTKGNERRRESRAIDSGVTADGGRQVAGGASFGRTIKTKSRRAKKFHAPRTRKVEGSILVPVTAAHSVACTPVAAPDNTGFI